MLSATTVAVVIASLLALRQITGDQRYSAEERSSNWRALGLYLLFLISGIALFLILPIEDGDDRVLLLGLLALLSWLGLGVVWLIRIAPKMRQPPRWLLRPWRGLDWTLILVCLGSAIASAALSLS